MKNILYSQRDFPVLQNRVFDTKEEALTSLKGDIEVIEDQHTGLIYNDRFCADLVVYDHNYNNEQSLSSAFQAHLQQVADIIEYKVGKQQLVEVGCGKGYFLEKLLDQGFDITGFDPTYVGDNPRVIKKLFEPGILARSAKGLILRHVLEHIQNPVDFLFSLNAAKCGSGLVYIEFPCFYWIFKKSSWLVIFFEHVNYFRLNDFHRMFDKVLASGVIFSGQYLYVVAELSSLKYPTFNPNEAVNFPKDFLAGLEKLSNRVKSLPPLSIWGGASKGVVFSIVNATHGLRSGECD